MAENIIVLTGPTATGKTQLGISIAQKVQGEVISADSRQIYRGMSIGTAQPTSQQLTQVPHHFIEIIDPDQPFSLAEYQQQALEIIDKLRVADKVPVIAGGTGLYIRSITDGLAIPAVPPQMKFRETMEQLANEHGTQHLYRMLQEKDPEAAEKIEATNARRIIRALEVCEFTGKKFSTLQQTKDTSFNVLFLGLTADRDILYARADKRVDEMVDNGLVSEVKALLEKGYSPDLPAMSSVGYKEIISYLQGRIDLNTAVQQIKFNTHRYIRKQYTWFRRDNRIKWFDIRRDFEDEMMGIIYQHLNSKTDKVN